MKIALLILVLSIVAVGQKVKPTPEPTPALPTCNLTIAQAPKWDTIRLGMTAEEFQKVFPRMPFMVDRVELPETPAFDHVDNMMFVFYRERLEEVTIQFDLSTHWDNIRQFTDNLSQTYNLPSAWAFTLGTGMLECKDFRMRAVSSRNEIKLRDTAAATRMAAENAPADPEPQTQTKTIGLPGSKQPMPRPTPRPSPHP